MGLVVYALDMAKRDKRLKGLKTTYLMELTLAHIRLSNRYIRELEARDVNIRKLAENSRGTYVKGDENLRRAMFDKPEYKEANREAGAAARARMERLGA